MRSTGQLHAPADLIPEKPRYTFNRKLNEPRTLLWRRDKLLALLRIKLWTVQVVTIPASNTQISNSCYFS